MPHIFLIYEKESEANYSVRGICCSYSVQEHDNHSKGEFQVKKRGILIIILAVIIACGAYVGYRLAIHGTDIIGVTTKGNTIYMNSATGDEFVSGQGKLTIKEGEHLHLKYKLSSGSFDLSASDGEHTVEQAGVEGNGSVDLDAEPGEYTVVFSMNGAVGKAVVTAKK